MKSLLICSLILLLLIECGLGRFTSPKHLPSPILSKDNYDNTVYGTTVTDTMREALIGNLHYNTSEVDSMDPRIALAVIEKSLSRPINGMPLEWRRHYTIVPNWFGLSKAQQLVRQINDYNKKSLDLITDFADKYIIPALPILISGGLLINNYELVWEYTEKIGNMIVDLPQFTLQFLNRIIVSTRWRLARFQRKDQSIVTEDEVDFDELIKVYHITMWDRLKLRASRFKKLFKRKGKRVDNMV